MVESKTSIFSEDNYDYSDLDSFCELPDRPIGIIRGILETHGIPLADREIREQLARSYAEEFETEQLVHTDNKIIFIAEFGDKLQPQRMEITLKPSSFGDRPWFLFFASEVIKSRQGCTDPSKQLESFAFLGSWQQFLTALAEMVEPEPWDYKESGMYEILLQYIKYTFARLKSENKICITSDKTFAAFNTGLRDRRLSAVYACFGPNQSTAESPWRFLGFTAAGSSSLGKTLVSKFNPLPEKATYITEFKHVFFDCMAPVHIDYDHVLLDNIDRIPLAALSAICTDSRSAKLLAEIEAGTADKREKYAELREIVQNTYSYYMLLRNMLDTAKDEAIARISCNYRVAVPAYNPRLNAMSFLMPLRMYSTDKPDVVLVAELVSSGVYQGQTILTPEQAYVDARLISALDDDWLRIQEEV